MSVKRNISDCICAFVVFSVVLLSIAVLAGESFFEGAIVLTGNGAVIFGTEFVVDKALLSSLEKLLCFNDVLFGDGFARCLIKTGSFFLTYVKDFLYLAYGAARWAVGLS